jgi:sterol 14-demethylase
MPNPLPPLASGSLPVLGHFFEYRRDHLAVFWRAYRSIGPVFSLRLGPQRMAVLVGPEAQGFFFTQVDKILSLPEVYRFVVPMFGKVLNAADDIDVRRRHLALLHSAFHPRLMGKHVDTMVAETVQWLNGLDDDGEFELDEHFSRLAIRIGAGTLMGPEIRSRLDEFIPLFHDLARGMDFVLPPNLPLPRFRRRDRARKQLHDLIQPIIAERQLQPDPHDDFLQVIANGDYLAADGQPDSGETIVGIALMTVFTAYIATSAQVCWSLIQLLENPSFLAAVLDEQREVLGDAPQHAMNLESLSRLNHLDWALKETQRMHPVMTHYARFNAEGYDFAGYHIPKRWMTVLCAAISHRDPDVFANPDTYDPYRFGPERKEDKKQPYALIGFGAGLYRCPGAVFGVNEMKVIISLLLHRYELALRTTPRRDFEMGVIRPRPPCHIAYRRRRAGPATPWATTVRTPIAGKMGTGPQRAGTTQAAHMAQQA